MATQKQIEANRRNARKSTGPHSASGKQRASRNVFSHGLSRLMFGAEFAQAVEALASRILGDHGRANDQHALASARQIAEAGFKDARVQRIKVALIERAYNLGRLEPRKLFRSKKDECAIDPLPPMPTVRRALPDLLRLNRYERRAAARRDRAIRRLTQSED
jgi:hypothetical protein